MKEKENKKKKTVVLLKAKKKEAVQSFQPHYLLHIMFNDTKSLPQKYIYDVLLVELV